MGLSKLGQAFTARDIFKLVEADMRRVEEKMGLESISSVDAVTAINRHLQKSGGKRLRPTLVLLSCQLFGEVNEASIAMAAVVEMVHAATLVHDDVIDEAK